MDVAELLALKRRDRAEREAAAASEPEFVLTEREFDYRLRRAFAERERSVERQVRELQAQHLKEVEAKLVALEQRIAEQTREIDERISAALVEHDVARDDAHGMVIAQGRKRLKEVRHEMQEQIDQLRADIEIATHAAERDHGRGEIVDLPALPLRSQRCG
ncbi:hypothetical protein I6F20_17045 [Bradyrhizobium sp. IC3123]|uniref:hypothetical protein n=1 Tax=Bradyrhizobium sp. IC3123 TaxID=2793803 RepID=UPI001CD717A3|nr:hypothetical protein [Bradyrhizobium sp. IC3123]MCA1390775.1 hypothetical protein [Bradyrhizobium sp. IC3123]